MTRWYVRCVDCLAVGAVDLEDRNERGFMAEPERGACPCGGRTESMGRVRKARLVKDELQSPCAAACTNARGPECDCPCSGANHGSRALVVVARDVGAVPRYELKASLARAAEYREAFTAAEARLRSSGSASWKLRKAQRARTHKGRLTLLASILPAPAVVVQ